MYRLRIKWEKRGWARFVSQLEMVKVLERSLRRAGFPLVFTEGFSPRPKISFGPPTPVGFESQAEIFEVFLTTHLLESIAKRRLNKFLPEGFQALNATYVSLDEPSLVQKVALSEYEVFIPFPPRTGVEFGVEFLGRLRSYLSGVTGLTYRGKQITISKESDFPEFSSSFEKGGVSLRLLLATRESKTIRPDALLLSFLEGEGLSLSDLKITKKELFFLVGGRRLRVA